MKWLELADRYARVSYWVLGSLGWVTLIVLMVLMIRIAWRFL